MGTAQHIESLLYRYQCVVVPSFGAFLTQIKPAYLQKDSNTFFPPSKKLSFNSQLNSNDGLLVSHIANLEGISFDVALERITRDAETWKKTLHKERILDLEPLGVFRLNAEGKMLFEPEPKNNLLMAAFGLASVRANAVLREELKEEVRELEENIPFSITPESRKNFGLRPYLKYAAIVLLSLTAGLSAYTYTQNFKSSEAEVRTLVQDEVSRQIQEATFFGSQPLELPSLTLEVARNEQEAAHHIIAGAFRVRENADKKITQLRSQGYDSRYIGVNPHGLHQVAYSSYSDPGEALEALRKIKRTVSSDAWMLSVK